MQNEPHSIVFHDSNCVSKTDEPIRVEDISEEKLKERDFNILIGRDGLIRKGRPLHDYDSNSMHVFVAGIFNEAPPTTKQIETISSLFDWFEYQFGWNFDPDLMNMHRDLTDEDNGCPGNKFPIEKIRKESVQRKQSGKKNKFEDYEMDDGGAERRLKDCNKDVVKINGDIGKNIREFSELTETIKDKIDKG